MRKIQFYKIVFLIGFWVFCAIFIMCYEASVLGFKSEIGGEHYNFLRNLIIGILVCIVGATLLASLEVLYLGKLLRKKPFGLTLCIKTIIYLMFMIFFISMVILYIYSGEINKPLFSGDVFKLYVDFLFSANIIMSIIYWSIACLSALFILQVNDKFGQGVLLNFLRGKYHRPKEEERIFINKGAIPVKISQNILRSETAYLYISSIFQFFNPI